MPVRFFYVDESYDKDRYCLSAISIRHSDWKECFDKVREHRVNLKNDHGVFLSKEMHARSCGGQGQDKSDANRQVAAFKNLPRPLTTRRQPAQRPSVQCVP